MDAAIGESAFVKGSDDVNYIIGFFCRKAILDFAILIFQPSFRAVSVTGSSALSRRALTSASRLLVKRAIFWALSCHVAVGFFKFSAGRQKSAAQAARLAGDSGSAETWQRDASLRKPS